MSVISADRIPAHWRTGRAPPKHHLENFARTPLAQFILLSMLLHALLIMLFGAPSGGSREGRAMWGALSVTLQGLRPEPTPAPPIFAPLAPPAPRIAPDPPPKAEVIPDVPKVETPPPPAVKPLPIEIPQQLQAIAPTPVKTPELKVPPALEVPVAVPQLLDRVKAPDSPPAELKVPPALEVPLVVPKPLESIKAPDAALRELSVPPSLEAPVVVPAPIERARTPEPMREMLPALELPPPAPLKPVEIPAVPIPPIPPSVLKQPIEAPVIPSPAVTPPPLAAPVESPIESKAVPTPPISAPVPSSPIESRAIPSQVPVERKESPSDATKADAAKVESVPAKIEDPTLAPRFDAPLRTPAPGRAPGTSPFRTRPQDSQAGDYDPTKPSIDVDAAKKRAGEMAREGAGQRALFAMPLPKPRNKMEEAIEKARKPDCKTAYQNLGLLAVVPLIANEFGEGNCRW